MIRVDLYIPILAACCISDSSIQPLVILFSWGSSLVSSFNFDTRTCTKKDPLELAQVFRRGVC